MSTQTLPQEVPFSDAKASPCDESLQKYLGKRMALWAAFMGQLAEMSLAGEWRYYNDGKRWLFKVATKKGKTACWVSPADGLFRVTCYFGDKASTLVAESDLPDACKKRFEEGKRYGKIRAITIPVARQTDLKAVRALLELRLRVK